MIQKTMIGLLGLVIGLALGAVVTLNHAGCEPMGDSAGNRWLECDTKRVAPTPDISGELQASRESRQRIEECNYAGGRPVFRAGGYVESCHFTPEQLEAL